MAPTSQRPNALKIILTGLAAGSLLFTAACSGGGDDSAGDSGPQAVIDTGLGGDSTGGSSAAPTASSSTKPSTGKPPAADTRTRISGNDKSVAESELAGLAIADKGDMSGYSGKREELFGPAWTDMAEGVAMAGNGCSTRDDILARDMTDVVKSGDCQVESGKLYDPYGTEANPSDHYINFVRGKDTSSAVQIDHLVALGNVWASGGDKLSQEQRVAIANDPINLLAVDGPQNGAKGDKDASEWLPKNKRAQCFYAASQIRVKAKYKLTVTQAEHDKLASLISTCNV